MRRYELLANIIYHLPLIVLVGISCVVLWPLNIVVMLICYTVGLAGLVYAKLPQIRGGVYCAFGPRKIPVGRHNVYYKGYGMIGLGVALNLLMLIRY